VKETSCESMKEMGHMGPNNDVWGGVLLSWDRKVSGIREI
jgi:hypothetical protein